VRTCNSYFRLKTDFYGAALALCIFYETAAAAVAHLQGDDALRGKRDFDASFILMPSLARVGEREKVSFLFRKWMMQNRTTFLSDGRL
jgi:hypothetical protein